MTAAVRGGWPRTMKRAEAATPSPKPARISGAPTPWEFVVDANGEPEDMAQTEVARREHSAAGARRGCSCVVAPGVRGSGRGSGAEAR